MSSVPGPWAAQPAVAIAANLLMSAASLAAAAADSGGIPALYRTQAEAERAATLHFNCTGAHKMGDQWMPCAKHGNTHDSNTSH